MGRGDGEEQYLLKKSPYEDSFFWMLIELTVGINGLLVKESKRQSVNQIWVANNQYPNLPSIIPVTDKSSSRSGQFSPVPAQMISMLLRC